jgi:predicted nucleic-acid-binding protein
MSDYIDANLILRYLTGIPEDQHQRACALVESEITLVVPQVALLETAYVLRTQTTMSREQIVDTLIEFVQRENILVQQLHRDIVVEALRLCRPSGRVSFGDAMIWAALRCAPPARLYSFDEQFPSEGIDLQRP